MIRRTAWALVSNLSGSYLVLPFIAIVTVGALIADSDRAASYNLLMSFGFVAAMAVGLLAGTTLTEIKVKPLSYVLPGQERSMAPAVTLVGALVCLAYALLLLGRPMTIVGVPAWQQSLGASASALDSSR
jgi:hydrogenase/urease accessory protein HupE